MCCATENTGGQTGWEHGSGNIAFTEQLFQVSTFKTDGFMIGYTLIGGGYGHGIGMSQNGAKHMAEASVSAEEILTFFYKGCQLKRIS